MRATIARGLRRVGAVAAVIMLLFTGSALVASPAEAAPDGCSGPYAGHYESAGGQIWAYRVWGCADGNDIPLSVTIQRYLSPGVYETVASGNGEATYYCGGTLYNVYRTSGTSDFGILCS